jgi:signal transduction histidine kinase
VRGGIRLRITGLAAVAVAAVLVATAAALLAGQRSVLTASVDEALSAQATELAATADRSGTLPPRGDEDAVAQITDGAGRVAAASANFATEPALPALATGVTERVYTMRLAPDRPVFRVLSRQVGDRVVHVATPTDDVDASIGALRRVLLLAIPLAAAVLAALVWFLVGRTLRPVEAIRREVSAISTRNLHVRVPEPATDDEIRRLAKTMNAMLERLEQSTTSQQRFVADASHELRSPLTRIRSELEVDLAHPASADLMATHRSVLQEAAQLQGLVDNLLLLARHDGTIPSDTGHSTVDLDDVVLAEIVSSRTAAIEIDARGVSAAQVTGDAGQLTRLVRNLLENAVRHARTTVVVTLAEDASQALFTVADDGVGIPRADAERVFDRFTRLDNARSRNDGGAGLGLAIARAITDRHHGSIQVDPDYGPGARLLVALPLAQSSDL